jgi:hypothetical protein
MAYAAAGGVLSFTFRFTVPMLTTRALRTAFFGLGRSTNFRLGFNVVKGVVDFMLFSVLMEIY